MLCPWSDLSVAVLSCTLNFFGQFISSQVSVTNKGGISELRRLLSDLAWAPISLARVETSLSLGFTGFNSHCAVVRLKSVSARGVKLNRAVTGSNLGSCRLSCFSLISLSASAVEVRLGLEPLTSVLQTHGFVSKSCRICGSIPSAFALQVSLWGWCGLQRFQKPQDPLPDEAFRLSCQTTEQSSSF